MGVHKQKQYVRDRQRLENETLEIIELLRGAFKLAKQAGP